ncbi:hypothetical protein ACWGIN_06705 [Streptomyces sp. NPDC054861]
MRNRFTSAAACLALTIAGFTAAAGNAAAAGQGEGRTDVRTAGQYDGQHGGDQWPVSVPPEVSDLMCAIQAGLQNLPHLPHGPHPIQIPHCKPVNGWQ